MVFNEVITPAAELSMNANQIILEASRLPLRWITTKRVSTVGGDFAD
jgi:hypothetical protein